MMRTRSTRCSINHKTGDFQPYLMKSTDRGQTWSSIVGDLPERQIIWRIVQDHAAKICCLSDRVRPVLHRGWRAALGSIDRAMSRPSPSATSKSSGGKMIWLVPPSAEAFSCWTTIPRCGPSAKNDLPKRFSCFRSKTLCNTVRRASWVARGAVREMRSSPPQSAVRRRDHLLSTRCTPDAQTDPAGTRIQHQRCGW